MAESRDRLIRPIDIAEIFSRRRSGSLGILSDETRELLGFPVQRAVTRQPIGGAVTTTTLRGGGIRRGSSFGTPRSGIRSGRNLYRSQASGTTSAIGRGRGRLTGSVLPSWYPRTPLRDITAVVRAIERRRARLGEGEGQIPESPILQDGRVLNSNVSSGVRLEHDFSTPASTARVKPSPRSVSKILLDVTNMKAEESEILTPQKKLLNSIDTVEKAVMEELERMKRTPAAKKAERQKKVRTLMSMR